MLFLYFPNSFDSDRNYLFPKHLVGHSYVIFERDRGGPVFFIISIIGCI
jgi:hypothetical protein